MNISSSDLRSTWNYAKSVQTFLSLSFDRLKLVGNACNRFCSLSTCQGLNLRRHRASKSTWTWRYIRKSAGHKAKSEIRKDLGTGISAFQTKQNSWIIWFCSAQTDWNASEVVSNVRKCIFLNSLCRGCVHNSSWARRRSKIKIYHRSRCITQL